MCCRQLSHSVWDPPPRRTWTQTFSSLPALLLVGGCTCPLAVFPVSPSVLQNYCPRHAHVAQHSHYCFAVSTGTFFHDGPPPPGVSLFIVHAGRCFRTPWRAVVHFLVHCTGCTAIYPGYGFLSENADFVQRCEEVSLLRVRPKSLPLNEQRWRSKCTSSLPLRATKGKPCQWPRNPRSATTTRLTHM